ncbi:MAG: uridine diphosphate-N-acetylglucosamine-binding protein YvcK [Acidobacteriia bacterium]|nr:uridine diphosphate-N-acetylglucosamine-binding protein YvcK [Terriglobia bacterium]
MSGAPLRIVAIGGGTGLSVLLRGLKKHVRHAGAAAQRQPEVEVTAVVTVTDDGGSSGRLRRELDVLPPGDIRNCMVALSEDEGLLSRLFQYRFARGRGLKGHSFGNLFLTALTDLTGDFVKAVTLSSEVLASRGRIFPCTSANVVLEARLTNGKLVSGETRISRSRSSIAEVVLQPRRCKPMRETLQAIERADLICLGPGSLFTSVIPNLLVSGIPRAIMKSKAHKAYFLNLMWQPGETMEFTASDHIEALYRHSMPGLLDTIVVNTRPLTAEMRRRYARERVLAVNVDRAELEEMGLQVAGHDLLEKGLKVRHNPRAAADVAVMLAESSRRGLP